MIRKLISIGLSLIIFLILIHKPVNGQELIPIPGLNCGIATTEAIIDTTKKESSQYRCCSSSLEDWDLKSSIDSSSENIKDLQSEPQNGNKDEKSVPRRFWNYVKKGFLGNLVGEVKDAISDKVFDPILDFIKDRVEDFPFLFWPFPGDPPFSVGALVSAVKNVSKDQPCEPGSRAVNIDKICFCTVDMNMEYLSFCENLTTDEETNKCISCLMTNYDPNTKEFKGGVYTAIGCIPLNLGDFIKKRVFGWGVGLAGVIALFCIIYAAFQLQTSQGSPEKIKKAQELLTSCIMGLMLIIFSVFILKLIGVDILRIPSFR